MKLSVNSDLFCFYRFFIVSGFIILFHFVFFVVFFYSENFYKFMILNDLWTNVTPNKHRVKKHTILRDYVIRKVNVLDLAVLNKLLEPLFISHSFEGKLKYNICERIKVKYQILLV